MREENRLSGSAVIPVDSIWSRVIAFSEENDSGSAPPSEDH